MDIPTLQDRIERRALDAINADIKEVSEFLKYEYKERKLFEGVSIEIKHGEKSVYPFLVQIFDTEPVREAIIKHNMTKYVNAEINAILNPAKKK
jgi:hypothetical protein